MDEMRRKIIITKNGQQIPVESAPGIEISVHIENDELEVEVPLEVSADEFKKIQKQAMTNKIPADILRIKKDSKP